MKSDQEDSKFKIARKLLKTSVIKIKDTDQMYEYIDKIFCSSDISASYAYYTYKDGLIDHFGGDSKFRNKAILDLLENIIGQKNTMGEIIPFESSDYIFVPIYETENECEILVVESNEVVRHFIENEFSTVLKNIHIYRQLKLKCEQLINLTHIDEVTGLFNQRKLSKDLDETILSHAENNLNFSLMFIDIDHFKSVNDNYGHMIGSDILRDLGKVVRTLVRSTDDVYRFGGDEFIILLREVDIATVHSISLRILKSIMEHNFILSTGETYKMSLSVGIAEYPTDAKSSKEMIQLADKMMYESKKTGRGKVIHLGKEVKHVDAGSK